MAAVSVNNPPVPQAKMWDEKTGTISSAWWIFFSQLWERTGGSTDNIASAAPVGSQVGWPTATAPDNWLICDGSAISRTTYVELFGVIGTAFGVGDGSTTFNIPDTRGRAVIGAGQGAGLTNRAIADIGGAETVTLTEAQMPSHNHDFVNAGNTDEVVSLAHNHDVVDSTDYITLIPLQHTHTIIDPGHTHSGTFVSSAAGTEYVNTAGNKGVTLSATDSATTGITTAAALVNAIVGKGTLTATTLDIDDVIVGDTGGDTAHENMMPFLAMNIIIRAL